jgi:hypothetical protein
MAGPRMTQSGHVSGWPWSTTSLIVLIQKEPIRSLDNCALRGPLRFNRMGLTAAALDRCRRFVAGDEMSREIETALGEH